MLNLLIPLCWNPITWLMDNIVSPMISLLVEAFMPILQWAVEFFGQLLLDAMSDIFFDILVILLKFVSFFVNAFFVFAGIYNVALRQPGGAYEQSNTFILQYIMDNAGITTIYWQITLISAALCIIFTGIAILRSINPTEFDPRKSVGKIWGRLGKTMLTFLVIPGMMIFGIELANMVAGRLVEDVFEGGKTSVDNVIFLTSTMNAAKNQSYNANNASFTDSVRNPYFKGDKSYESRSQVKADFELKKIDFITGYIICGFMIFILFGSALFAVRRLLEILLLFITAPLFVASMALDEGKRFESWRDMFVAKLVSCYGLVIMMMLYLAIVPTIMGGRLQLSQNGFMDSLLKLLFMIGGALAIKNCHTLPLSILNPTAAEHAKSSVLGGMGMAMMAGMMVGGKVMGMLRGGGGGGSAPAPQGGGGDAGAQRYNG